MKKETVEALNSASYREPNIKFAFADDVELFNVAEIIKGFKFFCFSVNKFLSFCKKISLLKITVFCFSCKVYYIRGGLKLKFI